MIQQNKYFYSLEDLLNSSLQTHTDLRIDLSYNITGAQSTSGLASVLVNCTNLSNLTLSLYYNQIRDEGTSDLASALANCTNLSTLKLNLGRNQIGIKGVVSLGFALVNCTYLTNLKLILDENQIVDQGASELGSALVKCPNLSNLKLYLYKNQIGSNGASGLGSSLSNCINFTNLTLNLRENQIGDEGASGLGSVLANCTNLINLKLIFQENQIGANGASGLSSALAKCTNLTNLKLILDDNKIGDEGASGLGSALAKCTNLSNLTLLLYRNKIGDEGALGLGSALAKCTNISNLTLDLNWNQIGDEGVSGLGSALAKCTNLSNLTLDLNLEAFFARCRQQNSYPSIQMKEIMMIQILDSLAFLHMFNVVHRDIKPSNFLLNFDQAGKPTKGTQAYTAPEVFDKVYKKLSDVFSVGIVLLELDNIATFDFSKTKPEQKFDIKHGNIFTNFNLDRQSQIYKIAEQCIQYEVNQRKQAVELLIQFIAQNQQYINVEIFSVINKSQLIKKSEQLSQLQKSIIQKQKEKESQILQLSQIFNKDQHMKSLIGKFNQLKSKPFETKQYEIILNKLQKISRFDPNFEFISVGATGLVLGAFNKLQNRHSVLKIQMAQKHEKQKQELDENQKIRIAIQIMDVINYLHINEIVHRDIKLENFLYIEQDSDIPVIKLADFDQARKMPYEWINYEKQFSPIEGACGTIGYSSPELMKEYLYTFKSDIFSVGVCLALIDNFETLEPVLFQKALDYFNNFSIPFQINSSVQQEVIKRNTQIYDILLKTVVFNQHQRSILSLILDAFKKQGYSYYSYIVQQTYEVQRHLFRWGESSFFRNSQVCQSLHFEPLALQEQFRFKWGESSCLGVNQEHQLKKINS
ncbi:hypothetical protein ABPG73_023106 [Tetrahymena malaccensis]